MTSTNHDGHSPIRDLLPALKAIRDCTESLDYEEGDLIGQLQQQEEALDAIRDIAYFQIGELNRWRLESPTRDDPHPPADRPLPSWARPDRNHPQYRRLLKALAILDSVSDRWNEDQLASYPPDLPSFDEYVAEIRGKVLSIEWK